ncbi:Vault protein inter-alpha-trypsin [Planctomycetes bacterium Poly30]|uniref:Vault protein inter-alpha-trypsin n=1 Tax=Saltatorellus ferox TaxID=2528018 RepID=A0A518EMR9_9BACT|nr:Vault protein inter-alpha-trypsin [Planctomycetes bacterium Poly30]
MNHTRHRATRHAALLALTGLTLLGSAFSQGSTRTPLATQQEDEPTAAAPVRNGRLDLVSHDVGVVINNGFATTTILQTLQNSTDHALEATWAFPLPDEASLSELTLWIDGQPLIGEVVEKAEASRIYQEETKAGESSAKLDQNGFVNYRITLSPVPAHGEARVRVVYYQPLDIDQGVGRYLYPLQNGNTEDPGGGSGMDTAFWSMEREVAGSMTLDVTLKTAFPVDGLHSPSHAAMSFQQEAPDLWTGSWSGQGPVLDRDFVLLYRLSPDVPARIELLTSRYADQGEGTFMAVITPGEDLEEITYGTDWMFVLDISGSMNGEKLRVLSRGASNAIGRLRAEDRFQVILFDDGHRALSRDWLVPGTAEADDVQRQVEGLQSAGGTNIFAALDAAYARLDADRPSAILLVSDGVANAGPHEYRDFIEMARTHDARLFTFVMGNGANTVLLGDLSAMSGGFARTVSVQDEVGAHLMMARDRMSHEAMHGVRFQLEGATVTHPKRLPSLYLGQQLVVFGRYQKSGPSTLTVSARISGEDRHWTVPIDLPAIDESNPELERLYAMAAIQDLERAEWLDGRPESETRRGTIDLALAYSLVTDHTSMVVVKESRKAAYGLGSSNRDRRLREQDAAAVRSTAGNQVQVQTGGQPLAGPLGGQRAAHAPQRSQRRRNGGGGAVGPLEILALLALLLATGWRRSSSDAA